MSHSKRGFIQGRIGTRSGLGVAIPVSVPASIDNCPSGFRNVFGACVLEAVRTPGFYTTPFVVLSGRRR
jgi:hypothetical protein